MTKGIRKAGGVLSIVGCSISYLIHLPIVIMFFMGAGGYSQGIGISKKDLVDKHKALLEIVKTIEGVSL